MPVANPDGLADGSRQFLSGVDPNRNWGGSDWRSDAFDSNAVFRRVHELIRILVPDLGWLIFVCE